MPLPSGGASTDSTDSIPLQRRARPLDVGRRRQLESDLDDGGPVTELGRELVDGPDPDEAARREDPDPVADGLDLAQEVAGEHDRQAALVDEPAQQLEDLDDADRVDRGGRLVEDQEVGRLDQGIGDAEPLAHAAGVGADPVVRAVGEADLGEDLVDGGLRLGLAEAVETGRVAQVLAAGHVLVEADGVGQVADPSLDLARLPGGIEPHHRCLAVGRLGQPEQHQDRGRLARAVLAEQPEDLARVDREVEPVDRRQRPVLLGQPARADDRLGTIAVGASGGVVSGLDGRGGRAVGAPASLIGGRTAGRSTTGRSARARSARSRRCPTAATSGS